MRKLSAVFNSCLSFYRSKNLGLFLGSVAFFVGLMPGKSFASIVVTPPVNGQNICSIRAANGSSPAYTVLNTITVTEGANADIGFSSPGNTLVLVLSAPVGWQFNTSSVLSYGFTAGRNISAVSTLSISASQLRINVTGRKTDALDAFTIIGLEVQAITTTSSAGNITAASAPSMIGITGTTNFATLSLQAAVTPSVTIAANPAGAICAGTSVTFTPTPLNGGAAPTYQWQLNGSNIAGATGTTYTTSTLVNGNQISVVMTSNAVCVSPATATSGAITMTVNQPPAITAQPSKTIQTLCPNAPATQLSVTATGAGLLYQWYSNSVNSNSGGSPISLATSLMYTPVTSAPGTLYYYVVVSGTCPPPVTSETSGAVVVNQPPAITGQPSTATQIICLNGPAAQLSASATGTGINYQWYSNATSSNAGGSMITGATSSMYTPATSVAGTLYYYVVATGTCSPAAPSNPSGAVTVNNPVVISTDPVSQNACSNDAVTLSVNASGTGTLVYKWYKGATLINNGPRVTGATTSSITLSSLNAANTGSYTVVVSDASGCAAVTSQPATLTVNQQITVTSQPAGTQTLCEGSTATFNVTAQGSGPFTVEWRNGATIINNGGRYTIVSTTDNTTTPATITSSLTINAIVSTDQSNNYYVIVSNPPGGCPLELSDDAALIVTQTVGTPTPITVLSGTEPTCQLTNGTTTTTYATTATNNTGFNWSLSNAAAGSITSAGVMTWANGFSGPVNIQVTANGCSSPSAQVIRTVSITPTVGTPTAITISSGTEPTCQLPNGTITTTYATTATNNTGFNWSLSNATAGSITSAGVMTWANGFSGAVNIQVRAIGCNGPSAQVIRTVSITPTVGTPTAITISSGTEPTCQLPNGTTTTTYATTATNNTGFNWSLSNAAAGSITSAGVMTWASGFSGSVNIQVTANGCNGPSSQIIRTVSITPTVGTPTAITISSGTEPTCQLPNGTTTTTYTTTVTNSTGFNWSLSNAAAGSITSAGVMTWANAFSGSVNIQVTATGCNGPSSQVIRTVNITPTVGTPTIPTPSATTICQASAPTTYTTSATNATSYTWTVTGAGNTISGTGTTATVTWAAGFSGSATISVKANGCNGPSAPASTTVTVTATVGTPTTPTPSATSICQASAPTTYTTSATNATSYTWTVTGTGNTISGTGTTATVTWSSTFTGSATLSVKANGCNGPSASASTTVTVYAPPTANAGSALISCKDASQRITAFPLNITAGSSATNYATVTWSKGSGTGILTNPNSLTTATYTPSPADIASPTGVTFTLTATGNGGCGSVFSTKTLTFTTAISGNTSIKAVPICSAGGYEIIPSGAPSGGDGTFSYLWEGEPNCGGGNGWPDLATSPTYIVPSGQEGFCFRSTITSGGCAVISNKGKLIDLSSGATNAISFGTSTTTICTGTSTVLTASSAVSYTYVWDASPTLTPPLNSASVTASPTAGTTATTTTYTVTGTATDGTGCQQFGSVIVTVNPLPTITPSAAAAGVCFNSLAQTTTLAYSATTNSPTRFSITWNAAPSNSFATVNDAPITPGTLTINVPGNTNPATYTGNLSVKNLVTGCVSNPAIPFNLIVNPLPSITTTGIIVPVCSGPAAQTTTMPYTATTNSPVSYTIDWTTITDQGSTPFAFAAGGGTVSGIIVPAGTAANTYSGIMTITTVNGCTRTKEVSLTVNPLPSITPAASAGNVCFKASAQTTTLSYSAATSSPTKYSITWNASPANSFLAVTDATLNPGSININVPASSAPGTYTGTVTVKNANGCVSSAGTDFTVTVDALPAITTQPATPAATCSGSGTQVISIVATGAGLNYLWRKGGVAVSNGSVVAGQGTPSLTLTNPTTTDAGSYDVVVSGTCSPSVTSTPVTVTVNTAPLITIQPVAPAVTCSGSGTQMITVGATGTNLVFTWRKGGTALVNGGVVSGQGTPTLTLTNPTSADAGSYDVIVSGTCAPSLTSVAVPVDVTATGTWLGLTNNWNNASNWCGGIPNTSTNVTIPMVGAGLFYPTTSTAIAKAANVSIASGASITVNNFTLQISGAITNNGTFNVTNGTLDLNGIALQTIAGSMFSNRTLQNLKITNTAGVDLSSTANDTLNLTGSLSFGVSSSTFNTNGNLTLKSSASATANVDQLAANNFISGNVTVERYMQAKRAWRFLSVPTNTTQNFHQAWQENMPQSSTNQTSPAGYGTQITNALIPTPANGFDYYSPDGPSVKKYDLTATGIYAPYKSINTTFDNMTTNEGIFTFVRGDRRSAGLGATPYPTILRTKGTLYTGTQPTINVPANQVVSVGNPYASVLDMNTIFTTNATNLQEFFYLWDPNGTGPGNLGFGSFQTFFRTTDGNYHPTVLNGSYLSDPYKYIQSGQGFFMRSLIASPGSLTFTEQSKAVTPFSVPLVFRPAAGTVKEQLLRTRLIAVNADATADVVDGVVSIFGNEFSDSVDDLDAIKIANFSENLGIKNGEKILVVERRQTITLEDTIQLNILKMKVKSYRFELIGENFNQPGLAAFLEDSYLNTHTPIDIKGTTTYDFNVINVPGSYNPSRFRIVFATVVAGPLPVTFSLVKAYQQERNISVEWKVENEVNIKTYEIEKSADGVRFTSATTVAAKGNNQSSESYLWLDKNPFTGANYYRIKTIDVDGHIKYSNIVKVVTGSVKPQIMVYPNPVADGNINLQLINQPAGRFGIRLMNKLGQLIMIKQIEHQQGSSTETLQTRLLSHGIYQLEVTRPDKSKTNINVLY